MQFTIEYFPMLEFEAVAELFADLDSAFLEAAYEHWLKSFANKAESFYLYQFNTHRDMLDQRFRKLHKLGVEDWFDADDLKDFYAEQGFTTHQKLWNEQREYLQSLMGDETEFIHADELFRRAEEVDQARAEGRPHVEFLRPRLDALWFDTLVANNDLKKADDLRKLNYEKYLRTPYWRRIRAAILLAHWARCQNTRCGHSSDRHVYGDEGQLHVHHMTYVHRGFERFDDLRLICGKCHAAMHHDKAYLVFDDPTLNESMA